MNACDKCGNANGVSAYFLDENNDIFLCNDCAKQEGYCLECRELIGKEDYNLYGDYLCDSCHWGLVSEGLIEEQMREDGFDGYGRVLEEDEEDYPYPDEDEYIGKLGSHLDDY